MNRRANRRGLVLVGCMFLIIFLRSNVCPQYLMDRSYDQPGLLFAVYDSDWNLLWSKDVQKNLSKNELRDTDKKIKISVQYARYFLSPPYESAQRGDGKLIGCDFYYSLSNNFASSFGCLYTLDLFTEYLLIHPMDRTYHLSDFILLRGKIYYKMQFFSIFYGSPYISIGFILCKPTNVVDFLGSKREYNRLPLQLGVLGSIGKEFNILGPFSIVTDVGIQKLEIRQGKMRLYSLDGIFFEIGVKWN